MRDKPSKPADPKVSDPLSAQGATPVEKSAGPRKDFKKSPVMAPSTASPQIQPPRRMDDIDYEEDFDEHISDLGTNSDVDSMDQRPPGCECHLDLEAWCECDWPEEEDEEEVLSEASDDGPEAYMYYKLKELRHERKQDRLEIKLDYRAGKDRAVERERELEQEHLDRYESFKREQQQQRQQREKPLEESEHGKKRRHKRTRLGDLRGQLSKLFCADYVDYFNPPDRKRIEFHEFDKDEHDPGMVSGRIVLGVINVYTMFGQFPAPKYASRRAVAVKLEDGREIFIKFLGNGHTQVKVPREYAVDLNKPRDCGWLGDPTREAPEVFKFVGAKFDLEKERDERCAALKAQRNSSAGEYF